jgi:hypothetical protein
LLVSLSPAPAQAQALGQAKVAIISARFLFFFPLTKNLIKGGISGQIDKNKNIQPNQSVIARTQARKRADADCFSFLGKVIKIKNDHAAILCIQIRLKQVTMTIANLRQR